MTTGLVKFGSYTPEDAKADADEMSRGVASYYKPEIGRNIIRFLPPPMGKKASVLIHQHVIEIPGQQNPTSFCCPKVMDRRPCPACAKVEQLRASGNPVDYEEAGKLLPKIRVFRNVIDRKNPEKGPQVFAFGKMVNKDLVSLAIDEDAGGDYTHPIDGFDIIINREGQGLATKYKVLRVSKNSPLAVDAATMNNWIESQSDLEKNSKVPSMEEMRKIMGGVVGADDSIRQRTAATRTPARKAARTAEDDAMEVDEE